MVSTSERDEQRPFSPQTGIRTIIIDTVYLDVLVLAVGGQGDVAEQRAQGVGAGAGQGCCLALLPLRVGCHGTSRTIVLSRGPVVQLRNRGSGEGSCGTARLAISREPAGSRLDGVAEQCKPSWCHGRAVGDAGPGWDGWTLQGGQEELEATGRGEGRGGEA